MKEEAEGIEFFTKEKLEKYGSDVTLFEGVEDKYC